MKISDISKIVVEASSLYIDTKKGTYGFIRRNAKSQKWYKVSAEFTDPKPYTTASVIAEVACNKGLIF